MRQITYKTKRYKTALNTLKYPDSWFWSRYTLNPYSGCEHACIYCDARSQRYYLQEHQDFETEVIIKEEIDRILAKRVKNARTLLPDVVAAGGVNDAYQPIELKAKNTYKILHILHKYHYPVNIATKSNLIARDVELFKQIADDTWCTIGFSISTMDEEMANILEPYASSPKERLKALAIIKQKAPDVQVGVYFMPIIPYMEDGEDNFRAVIKSAKESGADFVLFAFGVTLRDAQKEFFIQKLKKSKYRSIVDDLLTFYQVGYTLDKAKSYYLEKNALLLELCEKYSIEIRVKRWIPSDYRKWNYKIAELLLNKEYRKSLKGNPESTMKWAGLNLNNLDESIMEVAKRGELDRLPNFTNRIINLVRPYLENTKEYQQKKGLDRFL